MAQPLCCAGAPSAKTGGDSLVRRSLLWLMSSAADVSARGVTPRAHQTSTVPFKSVLASQPRPVGWVGNGKPCHAFTHPPCTCLNLACSRQIPEAADRSLLATHTTAGGVGLSSMNRGGGARRDERHIQLYLTSSYTGGGQCFFLYPLSCIGGIRDFRPLF